MGLGKRWKKLIGKQRQPTLGVPFVNHEFASRYAGRGYQIGAGTYGTPIVHDWDEGTTLRIGAYGSIADEVHIYLGGNHQTDWATTYPFYSFLPELAGIDRPLKTRGDVTVGNDVWLGSGCRIMSGVTIGDGAVIAAGSIVTKDVQSYEIVAGSPARPMRFRFAAEQRALLESLQWWGWPQDKVLQAAPYLCSGDIAALADFARKHGLI